MNTPFLKGESSSRTTVLNRRSAITRGSVYERAAALVDLAEDGVGLPEEILDDSNFENLAKLYFVYTRFDFLWTLNYFALIVLNFIERPLWCGRYSEHSCNDRDYFFLGQLPYLTGVESLVIEVITLVLLLVHILFPIAYEGPLIYWKKSLNKLQVIFLIVLAADVLIFGLYVSPLAFNSLPFRVAPYIRVFFFILYISIDTSTARLSDKSEAIFIFTITFLADSQLPAGVHTVFGPR